MKNGQFDANLTLVGRGADSPANPVDFDSLRFGPERQVVFQTSSKDVKPKDPILAYPFMWLRD